MCPNCCWSPGAEALRGPLCPHYQPWQGLHSTKGICPPGVICLFVVYLLGSWSHRIPCPNNPECSCRACASTSLGQSPPRCACVTVYVQSGRIGPSDSCLKGVVSKGRRVFAGRYKWGLKLKARMLPQACEVPGGVLCVLVVGPTMLGRGLVKHKSIHSVMD